MPETNFNLLLLKNYAPGHNANLLEGLSYFNAVKIHQLDMISTKDLANYFDGCEAVLDGIFGYSFSGPISENYVHIFDELRKSENKTFSIDVPSGWDMEKGNIFGGFVPQGNISLGAVKTCLKKYNGFHYFCDRFVPKNLLQEMGVINPSYEETTQLFVEITNKIH